MHHVIVYECQGSEAEFEAHARDRGQMCYEPSMPPLFFNCNNVVIAWGIGSEVSTTRILVTVYNSSRLGGLVVSMLVAGSKPGKGDGFLRVIKIRSTPSSRMGSKAGRS
jgi:hypothetical protein